MEKPYQRKWEELNRSLDRIRKFYSDFVQDGQDSFQGSKDFVKNFFRVSYELKESIRKTVDSDVEEFINFSRWVSLSIDISNQEKHVSLDKHRRTNKVIGLITSHIYVLNHDGKNRTELKIEIDGERIDCLHLAEKVLEEWNYFLAKGKLI